MDEKATSSQRLSFITVLLPESSTIPLPLFPILASPLHPKLTSIIAAAELHPVIEAFAHILNNDLTSAHFLIRQMEGEVPLRPLNAEGQSSGYVDKMGETAEEPPKVEGMFLHGVLHRIEGDYKNTKAWYRDVFAKTRGKYQSANESVGMKTWDSRDETRIARGELSRRDDVFNYVWSGNLDDALSFIDDMKNWRALWDGPYRKTHPQSVAGLPNEIDNNRYDKEKEYERLIITSEQELRRAWDWCTRRYGLKAKADASEEIRYGKEEKYSQMATGQVVGGEGWRQF